jgi:integrase
MQLITHAEEQKRSITGPYPDSGGRYRLRVCDGVNEFWKSYKTEKEALAAKARWSVTPEEAQSASVSRVYREGYGNHVRFRVHVFDGRTTKKHSFATETEAERARQRFTEELAARREATVAQLIEAYMEHQRVVKANRDSTANQTEQRLLRFFEDTLGLFARSITPPRAEALYREHVNRVSRNSGKTLSAATQQCDLRRARSLYAWGMKHNLVHTNPFTGVELVGRAKRGKKQFTVDEARRYVKAAIARFEDKGDRLAIASVIVMTTGARASEVMLRTVGELDQGGTVLLVREREAEGNDAGATIKNRLAARELVIHPPLRQYVASLAVGRPSSALLFRGQGTNPTSANAVLRAKIRRICIEEGLPIVTTHSFRGLRATMEYRKSRDAGAVAELMAHSDFRMTENAYLDPAVAERTRQEACAEVLGLLDPAKEARRILGALPQPVLRAVVQLLPAYVPGLLIGSTIAREEFFPNRSPQADRHQLSDGE